jgi:aminopeptidase YwaD
MTQGLSLPISSEPLEKTFREICSLGPRWQGSEGEKKILAYLEEFLVKRVEIGYTREEFEYLSFHPRLSDLVMEGSSSKKVNCQPLAYSGLNAVTGELIYVPEENLCEPSSEGRIVLSDALKSYQAYPQACQAGAIGFVFGNSLQQDLVRAGATNYQGRLGTIPAVAVGSKDTQILKELARRKPKVRLEVAAESKRERGQNFVIKTEGDLNKPRIFVCSHYDSMGLGPHAFDNASGTAAILEIIWVFQRSPYNLTFLLCGAEELGFWGSKAFVNQHVEECKKLRAVICLDGICSDLGSVEVGVTEDLAKDVRRVAYKENFRVDQWSIPPRPSSDHVAFAELGTPVFWLTSMDPFYHTAADVPEHVSKEKLARHTAFAAHVIMSLADQAIS